LVRGTFLNNFRFAGLRLFRFAAPVLLSLLEFRDFERDRDRDRKYEEDLIIDSRFRLRRAGT
jgi:hypothetical protein